MSALDVGCGPGRLSIPMAIKVGPRGHVTAVDSQLGMLERAKERSVKARVTNIRFLQGEIGTGNLKLDRFDRTVLVTVLGEMQHPGDALREIFAALKPGGLLAITEVIADPHFQDQRTVRELASAAGFREKAVIGGRYSYSLYFMKPGEESGGGLN
ncbi:MAG: class I SAM-dependent methyltransferase [Rhodobacteraceae bacterium]|nr:class I SAM-dependent methyltransferase [Paracoccaceae bacterium]